LLVLLGLCAAAFLFGAMRSVAHLRGSHFGFTLELGGPVVVAALVVFGGFQLTAVPGEFTLTVRLRGPDPPAEMAKEASIVADIEGRRDAREFSGLGEAVVPGIPSRLRNSDIPITFQSKTYRVRDSKTLYRIPPNSVIYIEVTKIANDQ